MAGEGQPNDFLATLEHLVVSGAVTLQPVRYAAIAPPLE
jgi:hypothetical protein